MKRILYIIMCVTALLTGCTEEIDTMREGMSEVTLTLATDSQYANETEPMAKTRSAITMNRYVMEIYTDEACTEKANLFNNGTTHRKQQTTPDFSLTLDRSKTYYCLFWADDGSNLSYRVSNLKNVSIGYPTILATLAYAGKTVISNNSGTLTVTLRRAVAQVVLKDLNGVEAGKTLQLSYPQSANFNVATGKVSGTNYMSPTTTTTATTAGGEITHFYMLAPREEKAEFELKFKYAEQNWQTISNIPLQANYTTNVTGHYKVVPDEMKFTIDLTSFADKSYTLPFVKNTTGNYKLIVDWGDNQKTEIAPYTNLSSNANLLTHTYTSQQSYQITISSTQTDATKEQMPSFKPGSYQTGNDNQLKIVSMDSPMLNVGGIGLDACFLGCSNLKTIPSTLFEKNIQLTNMSACFNKCTGLTTIPPTLFEKNTGVRLFGSCFYGCTGLTEIPDELFKTNTAATSFQSCFEGCTNLSEVPANIFEQNTNVTNFSYCFFGCSGLRTLPGTLFQTNTEVTTFSQCFRECSSLTELPGNLFNGNTKATDFSFCFYGCTGLTELPSGLFAQNAAATTFKQCFYTCSGLRTIPAELFAGNPAITDFTSCFVGCTVLEAIPASMFDKNTKVTTFKNCFSGCSSVPTIPEGLFTYNTLVTDFAACFFNCSNLKTIPSGLFDNNTKVTTFGTCFRACGNLEAIPSGLFAKNTIATNFNQCFHSCTKAELNANIFCDESTGKTSRFANTSAAVNFSYCFYNCGGNGTVPALWDYTYNYTPTKTDCFGNVTNATNKDDIDNEWK